MEKNKKLIMAIATVLVVVITIGIAFAVFIYQNNTNNQQLILGDIYMHYTESNGMSLNAALPGDDYSQYFEFYIKGKNTYKNKDIFYDITLNHGEPAEGKTEENRVADRYLKFRLVEVVDGVENVLLNNVTYENLVNKTIYIEKIPKNTTTQLNKTYRLYMVLSEELTIGNGEDAVMDNEEFQTIFGSVKVSVTGSLVEKTLN